MAAYRRKEGSRRYGSKRLRLPGVQGGTAQCRVCGEHLDVSEFATTQLILSYPTCTDCVIAQYTRQLCGRGRTVPGQRPLPFMEAPPE
jgi:hypothetical protein